MAVRFADMRTLILMALLTCTAFSAEMVHQRVVLKGGEELVGWWCADQGVMYLDNGKRRWIENASNIERVEAVPTDKTAPSRKQFKRPDDTLPYVSVTTGTGQTFVGWYDADMKTIFSEDGGNRGLSDVTKVEQRKAPGPLPDAAKRHLKYKAIEWDGSSEK